MRTFRSKLTVWNVLVLAFVMCCTIAAILFEIWSQELRAIDVELKRRSAPFVTFAEHHLFQAGKKSDSSHKDQADPNLRPRFEQIQSVDGLPIDRETEKLRWFRSPSFVDARGRPLAGYGKVGAWDVASLSGADPSKPRYTLATSDGEPVRVLSTPIYQHGQRTGVVQMATPIGEFNRQWSRRIVEALLLLVPALLVAAIGGMHLAGRALKPVASLTDAAAAIGEGDLSRRLTIEGDDELARLARTFNEMIAALEKAFLSRDEAYAQLESAFERQKRFTADAAHELLTPLTRIKNTTSIALASVESAEEYRNALRVADHGIDAMSHLVSQLLMLARVDSGQDVSRWHMVDLSELVAEVASTFESYHLRVQVPESPIMVLGDEALLACLLRNLLENATQYGVQDAEIRVTLTLKESDAQIQVEDHGPGIEPDRLPYLFDRFYRADESRIIRPEGSGLGLAICLSIVEAHGGAISVMSSFGAGTEFTVRVPVSTNS